MNSVPEPASATIADVAKDEVVRMRVTTEERDRWLAAAAADQRTLSDWLRVVANAASSDVKPKPKTKPTKKRG